MKTNAMKMMKMMKQATVIKSPKHFQLLFGKFQKAIQHMSEDLQDSAKREFCRVAKAGWNRKAGDIFFMPTNPGKLWRVRRVKGRTVWYLANHYGENPPRGILQKCGQTKTWIKVDRKYKWDVQSS